MAMRMTAGRRRLFDSTVASARQARSRGELDEAFALLETAHVIGQHWMGPHTLSHWEMLRIGRLRSDWREIFGQLVRIALVVPGTLLGRLPAGNTGGADVNPFRPMPVDESLQRALDEADRQTS